MSASQIPGNCARASGSASVTRRPSTASTVSRAPSTASGGSSRAPPSLPGSSGLAGGTGAVEEEESDDDDDEGGRQVSVMFDYGQTSDFELTVSGAWSFARWLAGPAVDLGLCPAGRGRDGPRRRRGRRLGLGQGRQYVGRSRARPGHLPLGVGGRTGVGTGRLDCPCRRGRVRSVPV
jgi:hypothetical protein